MSPIKRGALIVVEGVDRSGKSTQCKKLIEALEKRKVKASLLSFPDRTTLTGKLIDQYLKDKECHLNDHAIHLLFTANRWENFDKMKNLLYDGVTLVVDRYSYSGIVFSAAKEAMDFKWCQHPENGLPRPDLVFLLNLTQEEMAKRPGFGEERYETVAFQQNVTNLYQTLCNEKDNWVKINAGDNVDSVHEEMLEKTLKRIEEIEHAHLDYLNFK